MPDVVRSGHANTKYDGSSKAVKVKLKKQEITFSIQKRMKRDL